MVINVVFACSVLADNAVFVCGVHVDYALFACSVWPDSEGVLTEQG